LKDDLKVLILSASDSKGGAAKVAYYNALGLKQRGVDVDLLVGDKQSAAAFVTELEPAKKNRLIGKFEYRAGVNNLNISNERRYNKIFEASAKPYDIVHLHDPPSSLNIFDLAKILRRQRVVWTIHSMAPLTGNCLFSYDCNRWQGGCGACPQFGKWPLIYQHRDASALNLRAKRFAYKTSKCIDVVGVSHWTSRQIERSILGQHRIHTVENPSWAPDYFPIEQRSARRALGVPEDAFAIMFAVSGNHQDRRKGLDIIASALQQIQTNMPELWSRLFLLPTGIIDPSQELSENLQAISGLPPQHVSDVETLRTYYSAADVIWHPSRADTSSMVGLEAQGCGTPSIAASVGGVPEVVEHEVSGLLIPQESAASLANATAEFFGNSKLRNRLQVGALEAAKRKSPDRFIDEYLGVYRRALSDV